MKMKTEETIKLIKYVTGSVAAVLLAAALQLQFAYAAGIITLLTIQDTKKETVRITAHDHICDHDDLVSSDLSACRISRVGVRYCTDPISV